MKQLISIVVLAAVVVGVGLGFPARAADAQRGETVFNANCTACHAGGGNVITANKTLKQAALERYGMNSLDAIIYQVTNGKNAMPAFGNRLSDRDIEAVATYVLQQAKQGW